MEKIKIAEIYAKNEARNAHTENVLLLAENFGTSVQVKSVQTILKMKTRRGYINGDEHSFCSLISKLLFENIRQEYLEVR